MKGFIEVTFTNSEGTVEPYSINTSLIISFRPVIDAADNVEFCRITVAGHKNIIHYDVDQTYEQVKALIERSI